MPPVATKAPQRALRILVVDDNLDQVHSLAYLLKDDGHRVDFAINATAALDLARRARPEVVLLDIGLPDANGLDVPALIRRIPDLQKVRIIAVTGRQIGEQEIRTAGFDGLLRKPVDYGELQSALSDS
ncbi:MAG TPA: response regulator [Burkholderiales bacterium]|nr:response regulator [Burkholderiales bacterium]